MLLVFIFFYLDVRFLRWLFDFILGMSRRCAIPFRNFHFIQRGQMRVEKRRFFPVKFVICTTSTFSDVDN